jgi:hypothetical protein
MLERSFRVSCSSRPRNPIARRSARGKARVHAHTATLKSVSGMRWQCPRHRFRRSTCAVVAAEDRSGHHNDASKHGQAQPARENPLLRLVVRRHHDRPVAGVRRRGSTSISSAGRRAALARRSFRSDSLGIGGRLGDLAQQLVGVPLFIEILLEQADCIIVA